MAATKKTAGIGTIYQAVRVICEAGPRRNEIEWGLGKIPADERAVFARDAGRACGMLGDYITAAVRGLKL